MSNLSHSICKNLVSFSVWEYVQVCSHCGCESLDAELCSHLCSLGLDVKPLWNLVPLGARIIKTEQLQSVLSKPFFLADIHLMDCLEVHFFLFSFFNVLYVSTWKGVLERLWSSLKLFLFESKMKNICKSRVCSQQRYFCGLIKCFSSTVYFAKREKSLRICYLWETLYY